MPSLELHASRSLLASLLVVLAALPAARRCPAAEGGGEAREEWHLLTIEGSPAGYVHISVRPLPDGAWRTVMSQKLVIRRSGTTVEVRVDGAQEEDADGKLLGFESTQAMSRDVTTATGRVDGARLVIREAAGGGTPVESSVAVAPGAVGPRRADELTRKGMVRPGDSVEVTIFVPEIRRFAKETSVLGPSEEVDVRGGARRSLRRITVTQDFLPGVVTKEWVDDRFELQVSRAAVFGLELVSHRSSAEEVLREKYTSPPEVFLSTAAPLTGKSVAGASEALYRLSARGETFPVPATAHLFRGTGHELVREEGPRVRVLRVRRVAPERAPPLPLAAKPELAEFLRSGTWIQSDDPRVVRQAREIVGSEKDSWEAARALERWVHGNIREKDLSTAFASAREVLESRKGDCTEHAVLLAALLRAEGLPSRVVAGLVAHGRSCVGHMWTEVHLGAWFPLDATIGAGSVDADHLAFTASSLDAAGAAEFFLGMVPLLGNLEIEALESRR